MIDKVTMDRLHSYDVDLNLRYSEFRKCLILERKAPFGGMYLTPGMVSDPDERISVLKGYRMITPVPRAMDKLKIPSLSGRYTFIHYHNGIDNVFWDWIYTGDIYREGATKFADNIIGAKEDMRSKRKASFSDYVYYTARERARYMKTVRTVPEKYPLSAPPGGMSIN